MYLQDTDAITVTKEHTQKVTTQSQGSLFTCEEDLVPKQSTIQVAHAAGSIGTRSKVIADYKPNIQPTKPGHSKPTVNL